MLVQLKNLTKSFGSQTVLDKINLTVNEKDRLGIVGVNGAGKTTLFNIIAGALEAEAYENATDAVYVRKGLKIGYLRQVEAAKHSVRRNSAQLCGNRPHCRAARSAYRKNFLRKARQRGIRGLGGKV